MAANVIPFPPIPANDNPDWLPPAPMTSAQRGMLENIIERLIGLLDAVDGDCDFEAEEDACTAGDDGCGPIYVYGRKLWGSDADQLLSVLPVYGADQTRGPLNERAAHREYQRVMCGGR